MNAPLLALALAAPAYDPLAAEPTDGKSLTFTVRDAKRSRDVPLRVYLPASTGPAPVVLFSHGLGGSRDNNPYLGKHWSARGYAVVYLQHPGSDEAVWKNAPAGNRFELLKKAADAENFLLRVRDVPAALDQLDVWNKQAGHELSGRLDLTRVGMSGHSFGAVTTQAVSGQRFPVGSMTEPRIKAALMMSPSTPRAGTAERAFGDVKLPWMLMTGTDDNSPIGREDAKSRLGVYAALPAGGKYELVLDGAEHNAFGDRALPNETRKRNPNHHKAVLALSTAFWDATLKADAAAKAWLDGDGPRGVLEKADRWQRK